MSTSTERTATTAVDPEALRAEVRSKYAEVATNPTGGFHFHTGRALARRLNYPPEILDDLPDDAVASFAGVGNPFAAAPVPRGSHVLDLGSGGGFDCFVAGRLVGPSGKVTGVDMTPEMVARARAAATSIGATNVEFREGILEELPLDDGSVDIVISNGVLNLVADKQQVFGEAHRVLRPGGVLQFADIAVGREVPESARCDIGLWTDCIAGGRSVDEWCDLIGGAGFDELAVGTAVDAFGGAAGEDRARSFEVFSHTFRGRRH